MLVKATKRIASQRLVKNGTTSPLMELNPKQAIKVVNQNKILVL